MIECVNVLKYTSAVFLFLYFLYKWFRLMVLLRMHDDENDRAWDENEREINALCREEDNADVDL